MKCHMCSNYMELQTDPQAQDYVCVSGVNRKMEEYTAKDNETIELTAEEIKQKLESDPFYKLEHKNEDTIKAISMMDALQQSYAVQNMLYEDDFSAARAARKVLKEKKREAKADMKNLKRKHINLDLTLPETEEDRKAAKAMATAARFLSASAPVDARLRIEKQSIFDKNAQPAVASAHKLPKVLPQTGIFKLKPSRRESMPAFSSTSIFSSSSSSAPSSSSLHSRSSSSHTSSLPPPSLSSGRKSLPTTHLKRIPSQTDLP